MGSLNSDKIVKGHDVEGAFEKGGLGKTLFEKMKSHGDAIAQIDAATGEKDSYSSYLQRSVRTAISMKSKGLTKNDIVSICSFNHLDNSVPVLASFFLGIKVASLDPTICPADTIYLLNKVKPAIIFVGPEAVELMEDALEKVDFTSSLVVFGKSSSHLEFSTFLTPSPEEEGSFEPVAVENLKETAMIFFSSGTTGLPKGVCVTHLGVLGQAYIFRFLGINMKMFLAFASTYWISFAVALSSCIINKCSRLIVPRFDPAAAWQILSKFKVTSMFVAPSQGIAMYKRGRPDGIDTTDLDQMMLGGGPISKEQVEEIRDLLPGTTVMLAYGLTEIAGIGCMFPVNTPQDLMTVYKKSASAGRPVPGLAYKVVDIETEEVLGPNQRGELLIKTDFQMAGYYNQDSSMAWDKEGWLKTGDVGYYDDERCFFIVDRVKEMLKFQSWHVAPAVLEGVLLTHPAIEAAVVVGLPHREDGDHPMAVVVLKKAYAEGACLEEIEKYVEERVQDRMRLRGGVRTINSMPLTATGKIKRRDIRDMVLKGEI